MRVFKKRNLQGDDVCPICKTKEQGETVLIAIAGTREGNNAQAIQVHLACLYLWYDPELKVIYQKLEDNKDES